MVKHVHAVLEDKLGKKLSKVKGKRTWEKFFEDIVEEHKKNKKLVN